MRARVKRLLQNRLFAAIAALAIGYIAVRTLLVIGQDAYYVYHVYPKEKGDEYIYPEVRYTLGQIAIFLWSLVGLCAAVFTARCALVRTEHKWAARSILAFVFAFVLLVLGVIAGTAMRHFGP